MSRDEPVRVWVLAPSGGGTIASWEGSPPRAGDAIQVDKVGPYCAEPGRYNGVVQTCRWVDRLRYSAETKLPHHTVECFVFVVWDEEAQRAWDATFKEMGS